MISNITAFILKSPYAINFDADISDKPFTLKFKNSEKILSVFQSAEREWRTQSEYRHLSVMKAVYDLIFQIQNELQRKYVPDSQLEKICPAIEKISSDFSENDLSVRELASLCQISEVYLRKIFLNKYGMTPKEYLIHTRIDRAKQLLESGEFSIEDTALLCGYGEPCHFSREFSRRVGYLPKRI